jgi:hypothetical protein
VCSSDLIDSVFRPEPKENGRVYIIRRNNKLT